MGVERVRLECGRRGSAAALVFHLFAAGHARPHCGFFRRDGAAGRPAGRRADRGGPRGRQAGADIYGDLPGRRRPGDACARGLDHPARLERGSACARFRPVREQSAVRRVRRAGDPGRGVDRDREVAVRPRPAGHDRPSDGDPQPACVHARVRARTVALRAREDRARAGDFRPRSFQGRERQLWPSGGRQGSAPGGRHAAGEPARTRCHRALRRRGIRAADARRRHRRRAGGHRTRAPCRGRAADPGGVAQDSNYRQRGCCGRRVRRRGLGVVAAQRRCCAVRGQAQRQEQGGRRAGSAAARGGSTVPLQTG